MKAVFSKYHLANIKAIDSLDPVCKPVFYEFIRRIGIAGISIRITDAKRSTAQQDAEYAKGRTKPGSIVTWVKGLDSYHCWGLAIDIAPLKFFDTMTDYSAPTFEKIAHIAMDLGLDWGYKMWGVDKPHFQYSGGSTIAMLKTGYMPSKPQFKVLASTDSSLLRLEERLKLQGFDFIPSHI